MCPLTAGNTLSSRQAGHMTFATWEQVLEAAKIVGQVQWIGYGETLLHPRALEFMQQADDCGIWSSLTTNGTKLTPKTSRVLGELKNLVHLNVSVDSLDPKVFKAIRKTPLHKTLDGIENVLRYIDVEKLTIGSVVMSDNIESLVELPPYLASLHLRKYQLNVLHEHKGKHFSGDLASPDGRFQLALERLSRVSEENGVQLVIDVPDRLQTQVENIALYGENYGSQSTLRETRRCLLPWEFPFVDKDGRATGNK